MFLRQACLILCLSCGGVAKAQVDCTTSEIKTQAQINQCSDTDLEKATKKINAVYSDLRARLSTEKQEKLKQVQLSWIAYKDAKCEFEGLVAEGGSLEPMLVSSCLTETTEERIKELQYLKKMLVE